MNVSSDAVTKLNGVAAPGDVSTVDLPPDGAEDLAARQNGEDLVEAAALMPRVARRLAHQNDLVGHAHRRAALLAADDVSSR